MSPRPIPFRQSCFPQKFICRILHHRRTPPSETPTRECFSCSIIGLRVASTASTITFYVRSQCKYASSLSSHVPWATIGPAHLLLRNPQQPLAQSLSEEQGPVMLQKYQLHVKRKWVEYLQLLPSCIASPVASCSTHCTCASGSVTCCRSCRWW